MEHVVEVVLDQAAEGEAVSLDLGVPERHGIRARQRREVWRPEEPDPGLELLQAALLPEALVHVPQVDVDRGLLPVRKAPPEDGQVEDSPIERHQRPPVPRALPECGKIPRKLVSPDRSSTPATVTLSPAASMSRNAASSMTCGSRRQCSVCGSARAKNSTSPSARRWMESATPSRSLPSSRGERTSPEAGSSAQLRMPENQSCRSRSGPIPGMWRNDAVITRALLPRAAPGWGRPPRRTAAPGDPGATPSAPARTRAGAAPLRHAAGSGTGPARLADRGRRARRAHTPRQWRRALPAP